MLSILASLLGFKLFLIPLARRGLGRDEESNSRLECPAGRGGDGRRNAWFSTVGVGLLNVESFHLTLSMTMLPLDIVFQVSGSCFEGADFNPVCLVVPSGPKPERLT